MAHRPGFESGGRASLPEQGLPPVTTKRWVARRKAEVVAAVAEGRLSLEQACHRYGLTVDEFRGWQRFVERHGVAGLRTTRLQYYRSKSRPAARAEASSSFGRS